MIPNKEYSQIVDNIYLENDNFGDIIKFYNEIFILKVRSFIKSLEPNNIF